MVSGEALDDPELEPIDFVHEGRLLRLCCKGCMKAVKKSPEKFIAKVDAAVIAEQKPTYPMTKCVVSGEPLEAEGGTPVDHVHGTRLVRFCCGGCKAGFKASPETFMADLDRALIEAQLKDYPLEKCVVSDEPLTAMGKPVDLLYGTRLVRLCCKGCKKRFNKGPEEFLAMIDKARAAEPVKGKFGKRPDEDSKGG